MFKCQKKSTTEAETREAKLFEQNKHSFLWSTRSRYKIRLASANRCKSIFEDTGEVVTSEPFSDYCPPKKKAKRAYQITAKKNCDKILGIWQNWPEGACSRYLCFQKCKKKSNTVKWTNNFSTNFQNFEGLYDETCLDRFKQYLKGFYITFVF